MRNADFVGKFPLAGKSRYHSSLRMTPAMAARIAGHPWTLEELLQAAENL
jgi:hypothetical protein